MKQQRVLSGLLAAAMAASAAQTQEPEPKVIKVKGDAPTYLSGSGASMHEGDIKRQGGDNFRWTGSGSLTWTVHVDAQGEYEVNLCHATDAGAAGQQVQITSGNNSMTHTLAMTKGVFGGGFLAYETIPLNGLLKLDAGDQTIALSITNAAPGMHVVDFRRLELLPVAAKAAIQAERGEARRARADTQWLAKAGYGLMFHWTSQSISQDGTHKPYAQAVDEFDVNRFAQMVAATGAGYVLFTIGHAEAYCPAPLKSWEKYHPGMTTQRDLIAELADALSARGIKLMCYFPAHVVGKYPKASGKEFGQMMTDVMTEFGNRYKEKVAGYWFDGCYQCGEKYPDFSWRKFFNVCKAGNPNRIIALNSWIYPNVSEWQEYWAGETASPVGLPVNGTIERGPGEGLRYQALLIMEPYWVQEKVEMPEPRFNARDLGDYISQCMKNGGAVTINLGIYQDGSVDPKALNVFKEVRKRIRQSPEGLGKRL